jgi:multidrug efflux pump subunit AcrA (membrane-fusion protein)
VERALVSPVSVSPLSRLARPLASALAVISCGVALSACDEVPSNVRDAQPYKVQAIKGTDRNLVTMADETAGLLPVETTVVRSSGKQMVVPHNALIYNPDGDVFVYTKPKPETYVRRPVRVARVSGGRAWLSVGPEAGTTIVTTGSAELLATEYEILNQHP